MEMEFHSSKTQVLAMLVREHGVKITGFKRSLRDLAGDEETFDEWGGSYLGRYIPAAFRIVCDEPERDFYSYRYTVHVYEIENWGRLTDDKVSIYGMLADSEGPRFTLHVLDRFGREIRTYDNSLLEPFAFYHILSESPGRRKEHLDFYKAIHQAASKAAGSEHPGAPEAEVDELVELDPSRATLRFSDFIARNILTNKSTLHYWLHKLDFPPGIKVGNVRYWYEDEVTEWLQSRHKPQPDPPPPPPRILRLNKRDREREARAIAEAAYELGLINPGELL